MKIFIPNLTNMNFLSKISFSSPLSKITLLFFLLFPFAISPNQVSEIKIIYPGYTSNFFSQCSDEEVNNDSFCYSEGKKEIPKYAITRYIVVVNQLLNDILNSKPKTIQRYLTQRQQKEVEKIRKNDTENWNKNWTSFGFDIINLRNQKKSLELIKVKNRKNLKYFWFSRPKNRKITGIFTSTLSEKYVFTFTVSASLFFCLSDPEKIGDELDFSQIENYKFIKENMEDYLSTIKILSINEAKK